MRRMLLRGTQHREAVDLAHAQVRDDEVEDVGRFQCLDGGLAAIGLGHVVADLAQHDTEQLPHALLVIDDEDACLSHGVPGCAG